MRTVSTWVYGPDGERELKSKVIQDAGRAVAHLLEPAVLKNGEHLAIHWGEDDASEEAERTEGEVHGGGSYLCFQPGC